MTIKGMRISIEEKVLYHETCTKQGKKVKEIHFEEITSSEIEEKRSSGIPGFIVKDNGNYYYAQIPQGMKFTGNVLGQHMCVPTSDCVCARLSAKPDEEGGCAKVRDRISHIEKYDWITQGYETFNTNQDCLIVKECSHYTPNAPRVHYTPKELEALKIGIAQFVWDDVTSMAEVRERTRKNYTAL